jgi:hypothetical protein
MSAENSNAHDLVERIRRKGPEFLDLICADSDEAFEAAFDAILEKALHGLEHNKKNFNNLDEEGLSAALALALTIPGLTITQETNSNGHVDLTIEADHCMPARTKLGEAKIYNGPTYHIEGLAQLIERYMTGREGRGLLIEYVKKPDIKTKMHSLRIRMDDRLPLNQSGPSKDHVLKWSFLTEHKHSSGEIVQVGHIGCNLYHEEKK